MALSPPNRVNTWWAALTTITISGVVYAAVSDGKADWGYTVHEETVTGTNLPYLGTGVFKGKMEFKGIGDPTNPWQNIASITSGVVTSFGMTVRFGDTTATSSGARTWTYSGKFTNYEQSWSKDGAVMLSVKGILGCEPTYVQS